MTVVLVEQETAWIEEFARRNRPNCSKCGRPMRRVGNRLWDSGEFRTFAYQCWWCKGYKRVTTGEEGYHVASETTDGSWADRFYDANRPWCCSQPMRKYKVRVWEPTGAWSFTYRCPVCRQQKTVKTYEERNKPNLALETLGATRIDELIRSKIGDEDIIQDAWVSVLEQGATTEDRVLELVGSALGAGRSEIIKDEHAGERLGSLYMGSEHSEDGPRALDRVLALGTEMTMPLEDELAEELTRCPHCGNITTLVKAGTKTDSKGKRQRWLCRSCWRFTVFPKQPKREQGKVHIGKVKEGDEVDVSSISRIEVARKVGCSREYISQILCGTQTTSLSLFYDIAKACNCTMDELFKTISGANGKNPVRLKSAREWSSSVPPASPPRYIVDGKGYPVLREALVASGVTRENWRTEYKTRWERNYNILPPEIKEKVIKNW